MLVNTAAENKDKCDFSWDSLARELQITIGSPNDREFIKIIEDNLLPHFPVTKHDVLKAQDIFGPDVGTLKG
jgi:hypothetical protein